MVKLGKIHLLSQCNSSNCHNALTVVISKGLKKSIGVVFDMGDLFRGKEEGKSETIGDKLKDREAYTDKIHGVYSLIMTKN